MTLWNHQQSQDPLLQKITSFTVGKDPVYDLKLLPYDIRASRAHADGLLDIHILTKEEHHLLVQGLEEILDLWNKGAFPIEVSQEDSHTAIEQYLTDQYGDVGKKIHTGRSRNDQVLTMMRLYEKEKIEQIFTKTKELASQFLFFAKSYEWVPLPGYTHYQKAMPSSVGMWAAALGEMLSLNLLSFRGIFPQINLCPLGTGAGFGTAFPLPREKNAHRLGFEDPLIVSLTAQNTRGKMEASFVSALSDLGSTLAHFATDLIFFTAQECLFFSIPKAFTTGSSIMPHKQNLDVCEIIRGHQSGLVSAENQLRHLSHNLISGYHRDFSLIKEPLMDSVQHIESMLEMSTLLIKHLTPNVSILQKSLTPDMFTADEANAMVLQGTPFREAYHLVKKSLKSSKKLSVSPKKIQKNLKSKTHLGAPGHLGLKALEKKLKILTLSS